MLFSSCSLVQKELKVEIPDATWPPVVFKPIDTVTEFASLKRLRETHLAEGDLEIRIWRGFGLAPLEGVVLTRISGKWSALYLISDVYVDIKGAYVKQLKAPKSGWDPFWQKLSEADIATLPDPSQINCENGGIDGMSYVVEINQNYAYRAYKYETSYPSKCEEVQKMKQIGRIIANEFYDGKQECINARWFPCVAKYGVENDL